MWYTVSPWSSFRKAAKQFSGRVPGVMQSVLMPITETAHRGSNVRKRTWSFDPAPTYVRARTMRPVETGIKHARLRVYAPRRPNFGPGKVVIGSVCPRRTLREYATTSDRRGGKETRWREPARSWMSFDRDWHPEMVETSNRQCCWFSWIGDCTFFLRDPVFYFEKTRLNKKKQISHALILSLM